MAIITIYIEGGVLEHENVNVQILNNSQRLRESFYKILSKSIDPDNFQLIVEVGGGYQQTINFFKNSKLNETLLLIDLDASKADKTTKLQELGLADEKMSSNVFFMVQEMEAWILSQPEIIEDCFSDLTRVKLEKPIEEDTSIAGIPPEDLTKPSRILHTILGRYFRVEKKGKKKKKKYNKLNDGADLLERIDFPQLQNDFEDVERLTKYYNSISE